MRILIVQCPPLEISLLSIKLPSSDRAASIGQVTSNRLQAVCVNIDIQHIMYGNFTFVRAAARPRPRLRRRAASAECRQFLRFREIGRARGPRESDFCTGPGSGRVLYARRLGLCRVRWLTPEKGWIGPFGEVVNCRGWMAVVKILNFEMI